MPNGNQYEWQERTFHGGGYWVKNYLNKGQGRVITQSGGDFSYKVFDYRFEPVETFTGVAPSLSEAQRIVDEAFSSMEEEVVTHAGGTEAILSEAHKQQDNARLLYGDDVLTPEAYIEDQITTWGHAKQELNTLKRGED